ncbi:MAG: glycosyltransferase family 4 protein [Chloroflexia bacterium]|nr:glycosyltransferase family 4 protein [Chloroflexia bacterium]
MNINVAHFLRKHSQLKASFIKNQVENHIQANPFVVYKMKLHKRVGGFAELDKTTGDELNLSFYNNNILGKVRLKLFKIINNKDIKIINEFVKRHNIQVLHFHYGTDAGIYYPFLKINNIPSVVSFYGYDCSGFPNLFGGYGKLFLRRRVFPVVTKVLAMSPDMEKDLVKIGCPPEKIVVHHHGNDVKGFYIDRKYPEKEGPTKFLIVSGLTPQKGHLFLLKSFKLALEVNPNIRLTIVGGGPLQNKIVKFIAKNKLEAFVDFRGSVVYNSQEHIDYLRNHDVFIHPSITDVNGDKEGIPGAIIEAMSSGLPIISTYHAGIPYIIKNNETGLLVNEFDYKGLADAILKVAGDIKLQESLGKAGQNFALKELDLFEKEEELEKIYFEILNN